MRPCAWVSRGEFAFFARHRATTRTMNGWNRFESRLLGLHGYRLCGKAQLRMVNIAHESISLG
jgi:hypothetical protein